MEHFNYGDLDAKESFELKLLNFYYDIFQQELPKVNNFVKLEKFLKQLKKCYYKRIIKNESSVINFENPRMRCSYIFHFAACFSSIVAHYFSKFLHCSPWLTEKLLLADEISICCLGGGPATEFIATAMVLEGMLWKYCPRHERPLKLKATIVDINPGWQKTMKKISESLARFVDTSLMNYQMSFVQADLTKPLSDEVRVVLNSSDILMMSKFMTTIHGTYGKADVLYALQVIFQHIQQDGILFFLDSSGFENYDILRKVSSSFEDIYQIYGLWEHEVYEMSQVYSMECYRLYSRFFSQLSCFKSRNYVSAWHRRQVSHIRSETYFMAIKKENSDGKGKDLQRSISI